MKVLRIAKRCTRLDRIRNRDIRKKLNIFDINDRIKAYKVNWKEHVWMETDCLLEQDFTNALEEKMQAEWRKRII